MRYRVSHVTTYRYAEPVSMSYNLLHLAPRQTAYQQVTDNNITLSPAPASVQRHSDYFGNHEVIATIQVPHRELQVRSVSTLNRSEPPIPDADPNWQEVRQRLDRGQTPDDILAQEYRYGSRHAPDGRSLGALAQGFLTQHRGLISAVEALNKHIFTEFKYDPMATDIATPVSEVAEKRHGVCQDFAHLAISTLRAVGLAARYVSGYLETDPPPGTQKMRGADASHAWFQVYLPDHGWQDFDPTNGTRSTERHVTCAYGRDFADVTPTRGVILGGGDALIDVEVDVDRLPEISDTLSTQ